MLQTYQTIPEKDKIWAISPVFLDKKTQHLTKQNHLNEKFYKIIVTLTSGMLVKASIFTKIGFFDEKYFIYHVDTEYCFRARKFNYQIFEIPSAILHHQEGDQTRNKLFWKENLIVTNHSPIARYYISRNFIFLFKNYFYTENIFSLLRIIRSDFIAMTKLLIFENNKYQKISKNIKGLIHGIINRGGKY
jgi:rhamnosyltransferase